MIVYQTSILALPVLILIWTLNAYLLAVLLYLILTSLSATKNAEVTRALAELVAPPTRRVEQGIRRLRGKPSSASCVNLVLLLGILLLRHGLFWILTHMMS